MVAVRDKRIYRSVPASTEESTEELKRCGRASFAVRRCSPARVAVAVLGEIDAVNGRALGQYVEQHTRVSTQLVLDLRGVDFFGTQAFNALYYVSAKCARKDVDWAIVGNRPVRRLLLACDPQGELPLDDDLASALKRLDRLAHSRHELVWSAQAGWHANTKSA